MPERRADIGASVDLTNLNLRQDGMTNLCWDDVDESIAEGYSGNSRLHGRLGRD